MQNAVATLQLELNKVYVPKKKYKVIVSPIDITLRFVFLSKFNFDTECFLLLTDMLPK